ncbi:tRNA (adenine(58)-N(1))-methyltransferase non-catalytic subunit trm6 [Tieghemiomyces parasiticus]|uniref:tRNA (adenine(58)-N(1))-methyltransferase non-catalytic subunit TRM6 n=1 Tax=Tieghemiomyces parasiticus TaxID=78921 RepID=A0A9W8A9X4_9FUNG|nr:tRNA (adenine(58)-N(1))-methyltransferase non-catalytic subunit trm6 [Tieghemiomyces parasiticus]
MADHVPATNLPESECIKAGQRIYLRLPSGNFKPVKPVPGELIRLGKFGSFMGESIIGTPFGLTFEVYDRNLVRPVRPESLSAVEETGANNQEIVDEASSQQLSYEEIEALKKSSLQGDVSHDQIISKVVENNVAFNKKTEYSKAKYIARKQKKFHKVFSTVAPTLHNMCSIATAKNPLRTRGLRVDTLSQMLTSVNVNAYSRLLVVDDTKGLLLCAALTRISSNGLVLALHEGDSPNNEMLDYMPLPQDVRSQLHFLSWSRVSKDRAASFREEDTSSMDTTDLKGYQRRRKAFLRLQAAQDTFWAGGFDGLLIASQYEPVSILNELTPLLGGSRPVVIYSPDKESLVEAAAHMKSSPDFLMPQISESWMREYQVLPGRTHPTMNMSAGGGYLLTALRVYDSPENIPTYSTARLAPGSISRSGRVSAVKLAATE